MNERSTRIPSLDGLRAISIGMVITSHVIGTQNFILFDEVVGKQLEYLGMLGVRVFFVISGYLISSLLLHELDTTKHIHLTRFYFRRTFRIFPPYYFLILVVVLLQAVGWVTLVPGDVIHAITYTVNYHPERSWYLGHAWSLSVEEQFYLLWPATLLLTGRRRGLWIAFAVILICPIIRLGYYYFLPSLIRYEVGYRFETVADSIAAGCALAGMHEWFKRQRLYHIILYSKFFVLIPIIILCASALNPRLRLSLLFGVTIQNIGIAACIAWCVTRYSGKIGGLLNSKLMVFLGVMSYSIYLWQQLFLNPFSTSMTSRFPLNLVLVGAASLVSYYLIERPSLRIRHRLETRIFAHKQQHVVQEEILLLADDNVSLDSTTPATPSPQNDPRGAV